jgi:hypothetical protein
MLASQNVASNQAKSVDIIPMPRLAKARAKIWAEISPRFYQSSRSLVCAMFVHLLLTHGMA